MSPTFLHVVYAGRGDALIVEDQPNLYLVDGGPPDQAPGRFARRLIPDIYWDAVFAAAEEMGKATDPLELDGVVISHAHLDHFGVVEIFRQGLSTDPGGVTAELKFDRPLVSQSLQNSADPDFKQLNTFMGEFGFGPAPTSSQGTRSSAPSPSRPISSSSGQSRSSQPRSGLSTPPAPTAPAC